MTKVRLLIDDQEVSVAEGATVLEAARDAGIFIPTLCYHPSLKSFGSCRLCAVEIDGFRGLPGACSTPAAEGMVVHTSTPRLTDFRRETLSRILQDHPRECLGCRKNQVCELQQLVEHIGLDHPYTIPVDKTEPVKKEGPYFERNYNLCVRCGRCVRACHEIRGVGALVLRDVDGQQKVGTPFDRSLEEAGCDFCGACLDVCPTGAITEHMERLSAEPTKIMEALCPSLTDIVTGLYTKEQPKEVLQSICPVCSIGCEMLFHVHGGRVVSARPDPEGQVNQGQACVKGRFGIVESIYRQEQLEALLSVRGPLSTSTWEDALDRAARGLSRYKPDEVAVIASAGCTNEENYVIQKFARAVLKTNSVDHSGRIERAPIVSGLTKVFGCGAMTNPIADIAQAGSIFVIGTNLSMSSPVVGVRVREAVLNGAKLILVGLDEMRLARHAEVDIRLKPGSERALLMGMARVILSQGLEDRSFIEARCENFEAFTESLDGFDLDSVSESTGVEAGMIEAAARLYAEQGPACIIFGEEITDHQAHGTENVLALAYLAILTGNIGRRGMGVYPVGGPGNVQGALDMGVVPEFYPGYQPVKDPAIRQRFETAWNVSLPDAQGLGVPDIFDAILKGQIKALCLIGDDPLVNGHSAEKSREVLNKLEFLVAKDLLPTESASLSQVVLPAASGVEKDGTYTNMERRVQRINTVEPAPANSRPDWWIISQLAQRMGAEGFEYDTPSDILTEINRLTPGYEGITWGRLSTTTLMWPCTGPEHPGTDVLHADTFVRGKGRFEPLPNEQYESP